MSQRLRVYVSGPISKGDLLANLCQARAAGDRLLKAGFAPLVPHLSCYWAGDTPEVLPSGTTHEDWMGLDLPWVSVSDALLRLPGESVGADQEVKRAEELGIPVYGSVEALIASPPARGDSRYLSLMAEMASLHKRKAADYGRGEDPLANLRASEKFGIPAWVATMVRANDKMTRIQSFLLNGKLENEGIEDSLKDLGAYALLALVLYRESAAAQQPVAQGNAALPPPARTG